METPQPVPRAQRCNSNNNSTTTTTLYPTIIYAGNHPQHNENIPYLWDLSLGIRTTEQPQTRGADRVVVASRYCVFRLARADLSQYVQYSLPQCSKIKSHEITVLVQSSLSVPAAHARGSGSSHRSSRCAPPFSLPPPARLPYLPSPSPLPGKPRPFRNLSRRAATAERESILYRGVYGSSTYPNFPPFLHPTGHSPASLRLPFLANCLQLLFWLLLQPHGEPAPTPRATAAAKQATERGREEGGKFVPKSDNKWRLFFSKWST